MGGRGLRQSGGSSLYKVGVQVVRDGNGAGFDHIDSN